MPKWSWDAFAGGVAKGLPQGAEAVTNYQKTKGVLEEAREANLLRRRSQIIGNPDMVPGMEMGLSGEGGDLTEIMPPPERAETELSVPGPSLASARQMARGMTAGHSMTADVEGNFDASEQALAERVKTRRDVQTAAEDTERQFRAYTKMSTDMNEAAKRIKILEQAAKDLAPDDPRGDMIDKELQREIIELRVRSKMRKDYEEILRAKKTPDKDIQNLQHGMEIEPTISSNLRRIHGGERTRRAGSTR